MGVSQAGLGFVRISAETFVGLTGSAARTTFTGMGDHAEEFVSEPIRPDRGAADAGAMSRGLAGLPAGFTWRDRHYSVGAVLEDWKRSEAEGGRADSERYYRKHYYRIRTECGVTMTIYFVRKVKPGEHAKQRWWLYSIQRATTDGADA